MGRMRNKRPNGILSFPGVLAVLTLALWVPATQAAGAAPPQPPLEVNAIKGLRTFPDPMEVVGRVARTNLTQGVFSLSDRSSCGSCPTPDCASFTLPVQWRGTMPRMGEVVAVKGSVKVVEGKRYFVAETVTPEAR